MSYRLGDINDDQIRIISSEEPDGPREPDRRRRAENVPEKRKRKRLTTAIVCGIIALLLIGMTAILFFASDEAAGDAAGESAENITGAMETPGRQATGGKLNNGVSADKAYTLCNDTVINGVALEILTPVNATPVLEVGNGVLSDSTAVLLAQAADIREDNQEIAGSFVVKGELVGKGEAKAGFCSIINGEVTVGVADATPMFEEALTSDGYFFRQYPLVVAGQVVENKPRGSSIRRALADMGGRYCVVVSRYKVTFHDFSQALADAGVRNAIYLVGSEAYGKYRDASGRSVSLGQPWDRRLRNINYIVWR